MRGLIPRGFRRSHGWAKPQPTKGVCEHNLDDEQLEAMILIMNDGQPLSQPSTAYYATIRDGYPRAEENH
jgi:hypothetical protein